MAAWTRDTLYCSSPLFFIRAPSSRSLRERARGVRCQKARSQDLRAYPLRLLRPLGAVVPVLADRLQLTPLRLGSQRVYKEERDYRQSAEDAEGRYKQPVGESRRKEHEPHGRAAAEAGQRGGRAVRRGCEGVVPSGIRARCLSPAAKR